MIDPNNPASVAQAEIRKAANYASDVLTTWRFVHVEVDSMGPVWGNSVFAEAVDVFAPDGLDIFGWTVKLKHIELEPNRFENGILIDAAGNQFKIESNTKREVNVAYKEKAKPRTGIVELRDDDRLQNGQNVPMPDTGKLDSALKAAFVVPAIRQDNNAVRFELHASVTEDENLGIAHLKDLYDWDDLNKNSPKYWSAYLLGAFQPRPNEDNDPNDEKEKLLEVDMGNRGEATVFLETIWDYAPEVNKKYFGKITEKGILLRQHVTPRDMEQEYVLQAIAQVLASSRQEDPNPFDWVHEGPTRFPNELFRISEIYLDKIRRNAAPGRPYLLYA